MKFAVVSLMPEMFDAIRNFGVTSRAFERNLVTLTVVNPRTFAEDRHGTVDDRPYGGGPGMVMQPAVLDRALSEAKQQVGTEAMVIALTPQGTVFNDRVARELSTHSSLILVAGRYEGMDERFIKCSVDLELSVGDFVVSGGEMPAMLVIDAVMRWLPGVLGHADSAAEDSFVEGMLDYPHYTRPEEYLGERVPDVLLSGDHGKIASWRQAQALRRTIDRRPDLMNAETLSREHNELLRKWGLEKNTGR